MFCIPGAMVDLTRLTGKALEVTSVKAQLLEAHVMRPEGYPRLSFVRKLMPINCKLSLVCGDACQGTPRAGSIICRKDMEVANFNDRFFFRLFKFLGAYSPL